jgi:hypothetical protein
MAAIILLLILGLTVFLVVKSFRIVGPDEMSVKIIFGQPVDVYYPGWVVDLRFIFGEKFKCFLKKYPQKMYNFDYHAREVITKEEKDSKGNAICGAQRLRIDAVAYLNFPREIRSTDDDEEVDDNTHPLIKVLRNQVPTDEEELKNWTEEAVVGSLRVAFGQMNWIEAVKDIKTVTDEAEKVFTEKDGALIKAGFSKKGIRLVVAEIHLPDQLIEAMPLVDKQKLESTAAPFEAQQRAIETVGTVVRMMAEARGKNLKQMQKEINTDPGLVKEFLALSKDLITREMSLKRGALIDIRVDGAEGIEKSMLNAFALWQKMSQGAKDKSTAEKLKTEKKEKNKKSSKVDWNKIKTGADLLDAVSEDEEEDEV